jgi:hypothetical protein
MTLRRGASAPQVHALDEAAPFQRAEERLEQHLVGGIRSRQGCGKGSSPDETGGGKGEVSRRSPLAHGLLDPDLSDAPPRFGHLPAPAHPLVSYFGVFAATPDSATPSSHRPGLCPSPAQPTASRPHPGSPCGEGLDAHPLGRLLHRTFGTDVLHCPRCGGARRIVAVVLRSSTARAILEHLRLPSRPLPLPSATSPPQLTLW